ncbi:MAG: DUF1851 domain-containing protein [Sphingomonas sp.]|uniref:T6SS immunity protein Tdi1 domain-containing protein n=1 Tax=Sphingomonas sp. TaxID=28214 RepID=UPI00262043C6|nr:T6SS immunity protein Tdi1 domain-containing protein [Sphingomonas sp.]MDK2767624.1 DUF1851 domain-containing protein [Sphingomonas sp.]
MGLTDWFSGKRKDAGDIDLPVELISIGGPPELAHLFIDIPAVDILRGLDGWRWVGLSGLTAIAVSAFGEVFFRDDVGAIHQIDTIEGKLSKVAASLPDLTATLQDADARDSLLLGGLVIGARNRGLLLEPGECYDFKLAPIIGGKMDVSDMEKLSFVVKLHIAGQLHEQVKDLPPGTPIGKVTILP